MASKRSRTLDHFSAEEGLRDPFSRDPSSIAFTHRFNSVLRGIREALGTSGGSQLPYFKEGDPRSHRRFSRVLQPPFCGAQGVRRMASCSRCQHAEHFHPQDEVQYGDESIGPRLTPSGGLDDYVRHVGRILPYSSTSGIKEVSKVRLPEEGIPVQGSVLRTLHSSSSIYENHGSHRKVASPAGHKHHTVSRRLAHEIKVATSVYKGQRSDSSIDSNIRNFNQFREVQPDSNSVDNLFGDETGLSSFSGFSDQEEDRQLPKDGSKSAGSIFQSSKRLDEPARNPSINREVRTSGTTQYETTSVPVENTLEPQQSTRLDAHTLVSGMQEDVALVVRRTSSSRRSLLKSSEPQPSCILRRFRQGLGSSAGIPRDQRTVVSGSKTVAYQFSRTEGDPSSPYTFSTGCEEPGHHGQLRQYHGSVLHKKTGGDTFISSVPDHKRTSDMGSTERSDHLNKICSRQVECSGRRTQSIEPGSPHRVVPGPASLPGSFQSLGNSDGGSLCNIKESQAPHLLLSSSGSPCLEGRRDAATVGRSSSLCVSTVQHDKRGDQQVCQIQERFNDSGGPILASTGVVSGPSDAAYRLPQTPAYEEKATQATTHLPLSSRLIRSRSDRLQTVRKLVRAKGFSRQAAECIAKCRRESSAKLYQSKWALFRKWCVDNKISSSSTSLSEIADFFIFLRNVKKFAPITIKGYRAALSSVFKHRGINISDDRDLSDLIKSFETSKVKREIVPTAWNLDIVLKFLSGAPFEPLAKASLRDLTRKTLFLVSLATAKRVSEVRAIDREVGFNQEDAVCSHVIDFLAKNESLDKPWPRSFTIKSLSSLFSNQEEERTLCPVRALKFYLKRTQNIRGPSRLLWCSVRNPTRSLSKNALSFFLRSVIKEAHSSLSYEEYASLKVKAHEVRAVATSLAFRKNMSLSDIIQSTYWRCRSVFANFYLKDVENIFSSCSTLGPFSVAGTVLGGEA